MDPSAQGASRRSKTAITAAEAKTSGEIVVVVAAIASGGYYVRILMWAALLALARAARR